MGHKIEEGGVNSVLLVQDRKLWRALVNTATDHFPQSVRNNQLTKFYLIGRFLIDKNHLSSRVTFSWKILFGSHWFTMTPDLQYYQCMYIHSNFKNFLIEKCENTMQTLFSLEVMICLRVENTEIWKGLYNVLISWLFFYFTSIVGETTFCEI